MTVGVWEQEGLHRFVPAALRRLTIGSDLMIQAASGLSLFAGIIHAWAAPEHLDEWWASGAFFIAAAAAQILYVVLLERLPSPSILLAGIAGNLSIVWLYVVSRTRGVPFGPHAGEVEAAGVIDLAATAAELALVVLLGLTLARRSSIGPVRKGSIGKAFMLAVLAAAALPSPSQAAHVDTPLSHVEAPAEHIEAPTGNPEPHDTMPVSDDELMMTEEDHTKPPCTPTAAPPAGPVDDTATAVVYSLHGVIWLWDAAGDSARALTTSYEECFAHSPRFHSRNIVTFEMNGAVYDIDLTTGVISLLVPAEPGVTTFIWGPDGTELFYLTSAVDADTEILQRFSPATGRSLVAHRFTDTTPDVCGGETTEVRMDWSPDGSKLLISHGWFESQNIYVFDRNFKQLVTPQTGTYGRWVGSDTIVFLRWEEEGERWYSLDVGSGDLTRLPIKGERRNPEVSPDGTKIAYDDGAGVYVYDIAAKTERALGTGFAAAVWLGPDLLAVSDVELCEECEHGGSHGKGTTTRIGLDGARSNIKAHTTFDSGVVIGEIAPEVEEPTDDAEPEPTEEPTPEPAPSSSPEPLPLPSL